MLSTEKEIEEHTNILVPALASIVCELELSQEEVVVPEWRVHGAPVAAKRSRAEEMLTTGTKATTARYLGNHQQHDRAEAHCSGEHMMLYCFTYARVWRSRHINLKNTCHFSSRTPHSMRCGQPTAKALPHAKQLAPDGQRNSLKWTLTTSKESPRGTETERKHVKSTCQRGEGYPLTKLLLKTLREEGADARMPEQFHESNQKHPNSASDDTSELT